MSGPRCVIDNCVGAKRSGFVLPATLRSHAGVHEVSEVNEKFGLLGGGEQGPRSHRDVKRALLSSRSSPLIALLSHAQLLVSPRHHNTNCLPTHTHALLLWTSTLSLLSVARSLLLLLHSSSSLFVSGFVVFVVVIAADLTRRPHHASLECSLLRDGGGAVAGKVALLVALEASTLAARHALLRAVAREVALRAAVVAAARARRGLSRWLMRRPVVGLLRQRTVTRNVALTLTIVAAVRRVEVSDSPRCGNSAGWVHG